MPRLSVSEIIESFPPEPEIGVQIEQNPSIQEFDDGLDRSDDENYLDYEPHSKKRRT